MQAYAFPKGSPPKHCCTIQFKEHTPFFLCFYCFVIVRKHITEKIVSSSYDSEVHHCLVGFTALVLAIKPAA